MEQMTDDEAVEITKSSIADADDMIDGLVRAMQSANQQMPGRDDEIAFSTIIVWLFNNTDDETRTAALARAVMRLGELGDQ